MKTQYLLGFDYGTSGVKVGIFNVSGTLLAASYQRYGVYVSPGGVVEESPAEWWKATVLGASSVIKEASADSKDIVAASFCAMCGLSVPIDVSGQLLANRVMMWNDTRYWKWDHDLGAIKWYEQEQPDLFSKTHRMIDALGYIILKMTGKDNARSISMIDTSSSYDIKKNEYRKPFFEQLGVNPSIFAKGYEMTDIVGTVCAEAAKETGLPEGMPIIMGTSDNMGCMLGGGGTLPGSFVLYSGTAAWVGTICDHPLSSPDGALSPIYRGKGIYYHSVNSHTSGPPYEWAIDQVFLGYSNHRTEKTVIDFQALANTAPAGSDGVMFMPAFASGNSTYQHTSMRATYLGIRPSHTKAHLVRATMEGIGYDLMLSWHYFAEYGEKADVIRLIGGGAKNALQAKIFASMLNTPVTRIKNPQFSGVRGAMLLAGVGTGVFSNFDVVEEFLIPQDIIYPDAEMTRIYEKNLPLYRSYYQALIHMYSEAEQ